MTDEKRTKDSEIQLLELQLYYAFDYGIDLKNRKIQLTETIEYPMFDLLDNGLTFMEAENGKSITIKVFSPGGYVYDALAIVGRIKKSRCKIITEGYGQVMSAATLILACGDERRMSRYGYFMHHESHISVDGRQKFVENEIEQSKKEHAKWAEYMARFSNQTAEFWSSTGTGVDSYMTPEQLLEVGVIDEIF